jgi:general secretion pathway protein J
MCSKRRPRAAVQAGLTLVELLVAISILAFVAVLGWRGLDGIVRARVGLTADLEQTRGIQLAFAQLQSDCAQMVTPSTIPDRSPLVVDKGRLMLVRTVFADNQPTRLQVVTYQVKDGVLTRKESTSTRDLKELDGLWVAALAESDKSQAVVLQTGVASMRTRLWTSDGQGWRTGDVDTVLTTPAPAPPTPAGLPPGVVSKGQVMEQAGSGPRASLTGLEIALRMEGRDSLLLKIFMLGAV